MKHRAWAGRIELVEACHDREWVVEGHNNPRLYYFLILEGLST